MSKRILNLNNCTFMCPALQGEILKKQSNHKFNDGTGITLTKETTLTGAGICAILTAQADGTPMPCTLKNSNNWLVGIEFDKKINGIPILNEDAEMPCNVGSVITVKKPLMPIIPVVPELSAINGNSDSLSSSENTVSEKNAVNPVNNNDTSEESAEKNSDKKKYYKLCCDSEYESAFRPFIKKIKNSCSESEFNFLEKKPLNWKISGEEDFCFKDLYYVNNQVLIINKQIWDKALSIVETDEIFQIPLEITKNGEKHYYNIIFLARIDCIDYRGKIISGNTGRYNIFKSKISEDYSVYVSEKLMTELKEFTTLKFKGVD